MSELGPNRNQLMIHLTADYTTPENLEILEEEKVEGSFGMSLTAFLAHARNEETVEERLRSEENTEIGSIVNESLQDSYITESFKDFIVNSVRHAHAYETKVSDEVSPVQLGIDVGLGIFDSEQAPEVEAQSLRGRLFNIVNRHILMVEADGQKAPVIIHAASYYEEMSVLNAWLVDYINAFGKDPFTDIEMGSYLLAATTVKEANAEQNQQMQQIFHNLQAIRNREEDTEQ